MQYVKLGNSGLKVSKICLGGMSFGDTARGGHSWVIQEEEARPIIQRAVEAGINFFDTANAYSGGSSEEILGRALKDFGTRDNFVLATKVYFPMSSDQNSGGLSRKAIMKQAEDSLRRLGTDYIDLYQIHRWDPDTPILETLEALHDLVKSGKVRYIGASSMYAWQFCKALYLADKHGLTRFVSMQNHLNLLNREEEREMLPLCSSEGIGVIPWSPLARGRLARTWDNKGATTRGQNDNVTKALYSASEESDEKIVRRVSELAAIRGIPEAQIALAWLFNKSPVAAPIVGATKLKYLDDALGALSVKLSVEEIKFLEELYVPHEVAGHS